jgi:hypothetical protein
MLISVHSVVPPGSGINAGRCRHLVVRAEGLYERIWGHEAVQPAAARERARGRRLNQKKQEL